MLTYLLAYLPHNVYAQCVVRIVARMPNKQTKKIFLLMQSLQFSNDTKAQRKHVQKLIDILQQQQI